MIELAAWIIALGLLFFGAPRSKLREVILSLLFMQSISFILSSITIHYKLISYPIRFFSYVSRTSITFEFLVFPVVSVLYNLYYPKNGIWLKKLLYSISFPSVIILFEGIIENYTNNIKYLHWNVFLSWISMFLILQISYRFYRWFFSKYYRSKKLLARLSK